MDKVDEVNTRFFAILCLICERAASFITRVNIAQKVGVDPDDRCLPTICAACSYDGKNVPGVFIANRSLDPDECPLVDPSAIRALETYQALRSALGAEIQPRERSDGEEEQPVKVIRQAEIMCALSAYQENIPGGLPMLRFGYNAFDVRVPRWSETCLTRMEALPKSNRMYGFFDNRI